MPRDFYPRPEAQIVSFTQILSNCIHGDPLGYGFSEQIAADYATLQQAFAQAYALVHSNSTDCSSAYQVKNAAAVALEKATRSLAGQMKANPEVTAQMLQNVGLSRRAPRRNHVRVPHAPPTLHVVEATGSELTLQIFDSESTRRGKPRDACMVSIYGFVGDEPPATIAGYRQMKDSSRANGVKVRFDEQLPAGTKVWLTAAWRSARGEAGTGCAPVYTYLGHSVPIPGRNLRLAA